MIWRALCPRRSILSRASGWSRAPTVLLILPVRDGIGPSLLADASFGLGRVLVPWDRAATPAPRQWGRGNHLSARVDHLSGGPDTKDAGLAGGIDSDEAPSSMERLWSPAVATGWQPVANRTVPKNCLDTPKPLPWVTTACREDHMISTSANARASPEESRRMLRQIGPR